MLELKLLRFPLEWKEDEGLVVGYANKAVVDDGRDFIPADVWYDALRTFFREGMPIKLLHRPELTVGETVWLKIVSDGLVLASRPLYPEIAGLIRRGLLKAYSIGYRAKDVEFRPDGVRVIKSLDLYEVSYVDTPMNKECFFEGITMKMNHEVFFDAEKGVVSIMGLTPEEMGQVASAIKELLVKAGVPEDATLNTIEFKAADPKKPVAEEPEEPEEPEEIEEEIEEEDLEDVDWDEVFDIYYKILDGEEIPEEKVRWTRRYINRLPDAAFAVIEPAYERGESKDKNCRHLPHHKPSVKNPNEDKSVDLPHYRNALARCNQIKPVTDSISAEELRRRAAEHLEVHRNVLKTEQEKGLLGKLKDLLALVRGEKEEPASEAPPEEEKAEPAPDYKDVISGLEGKLGELQTIVAKVQEEQAELKAALENIVEILKGIVPPRMSKIALDTQGEKKPQFKWGLFVK